jgi:hypothetical protein
MPRRLLALTILLIAPLAARGVTGRPDASSIERLTGAKGAWNEKEGVFKVSSPRSDLAVSVGGVRVTPAMGLTSWAAFSGSKDTAMVMGDMVLTEDQVDSVLKVALEAGLEVTGLHNHFLGETPRILFLHVGGMGDEKRLATAVGRVFARIAERSGSGTPPVGLESIDPASTSLSVPRIEAALGTKGDLKDGVYKVVVGRTVRVHGSEAGAAMGVNTWAAFAGTDERAVVDGDFAMVDSEVQNVLKALTKWGIHVVAIHNHMTGEEPRMVFLHYWGVARAEELAKGVRAALDATRRPSD